MKINLEVKPREHFSRYLFGSAVYAENPSDIDIAIVYDKQFVKIENALAYRNELVDELSQLNSVPIDTILLSKEEENEMSFLMNAKHIEF